MAMKNFSHLLQGPNPSLGTISIHISSTNTKVFTPETINHQVVHYLKDKGLDVGTLSIETCTEVTRNGFLKTVRILLIVEEASKDTD